MNQLCSETGCTKKAETMLHGSDLNKWPVCMDHLHKHTNAATTPKTIKVSTYDIELNKGWMIVKKEDRPVTLDSPYRNLSIDMVVYTVVESESDIYDVRDTVVAKYGSDGLIHHAEEAKDYLYALRDTDVIFRIPATTI